MKKSENTENMAGNKLLYILDASVILKWFLNETGTEQDNALEIKNLCLKGDIEVAVPQYVFAEILNILIRYKSAKEVLKSLSYLFILSFYIYPISLEMASLGLEMMEKSPRVSFYDAGYHALALQHGGVFITADEKYFHQTKRKDAIMLLKDYGKKR